MPEVKIDIPDGPRNTPRAVKQIKRELEGIWSQIDEIKAAVQIIADHLSEAKPVERPAKKAPKKTAPSRSTGESE